MCLKTNLRGRNNPVKEILIFKVLIHSEGKIYAPFTKYEYTLEETLCDSSKETITNKQAYKLITSGYFHACTNVSAIKSLVIFLSKNIPKENIFIHTGIIPANTKYYLDGKGNICSKAIKVFDKYVQMDY